MIKKSLQKCRPQIFKLFVCTGMEVEGAITIIRKMRKRILNLSLIMWFVIIIVISQNNFWVLFQGSCEFFSNLSAWNFLKLFSDLMQCYFLLHIFPSTVASLAAQIFHPMWGICSQCLLWRLNGSVEVKKAAGHWREDRLGEISTVEDISVILSFFLSDLVINKFKNTSLMNNLSFFPFEINFKGGGELHNSNFLY